MVPSNKSLPKITEASLAFLREREGFSAKPYPDAAGYSIGYGHYIGSNPQRLTSVTREQAEKWLMDDATEAGRAIYSGVKVALNQNQFDALLSFVYNIGGTDFLASTLLRKLNAGDTAGAAIEFSRWVYSSMRLPDGTIKKDINPGLVTRRNLERALFQS